MKLSRKKKLDFKTAANVVRFTTRNREELHSQSFAFDDWNPEAVASFQVPSENPTEVATQWSAMLNEFGGIEESRAQKIGEIFAENHFPLPSNEASCYLNHDVLKELSITCVGERAKILLAVKRIPTIQFTPDTSMRLQSAHPDPNGSYQNETNKVRVFTTARGGVTWIDLVGKDSRNPTGESCAPTEYEKEMMKLRRKFDYSRKTVVVAEHPQGIVADEIRTLSDTDGDDAMLPQSKSYVFSSFENKMTVEADSIWDVDKLQMPLPHMVINPNKQHEAAFVLRVCTLGTKIEDATVNNLTNRWLIFVNAKERIIATVHRVDSIALASMRDKLATEVSGFDPSFSQILSHIFYQFVQEFEIALDHGTELLDQAETDMLEPSSSNSLLHTLYHLDRKASVYERMIDLNQSLMHEVTEHFDITKDVTFLNSRWLHLRTKAVAMQDRSTNLLQLLLALSGHRMNDMMAVLTKVSIVFTPIMFVVGVYGMNFENMPELKSDNGYFICVGVMGCLFLLMVSWVRLYL